MLPEQTSVEFFAQPVEYVETTTCRMAFRRFGVGPPVLFLHGWPFNSFTYRFLAQQLRQQFSCYLLDLPGMGNTVWSEQTDFSFPGQARNLREMVTALGLTDYFLVAHNTGASIGRLLAHNDGARLKKMVLFNTEIPGHRPPWIPLYRRLMFVPAVNLILRWLIQQRWFVQAGMGFGGCFEDKRLLDGEFRTLFLQETAASAQRIEGLNRYLRGLDWEVIDGLAQVHGEIETAVLFLWGANDPTFPEALGREMALQFANCAGFVSVKESKLLLYEEKPAQVSALIADFFGAAP